MGKESEVQFQSGVAELVSDDTSRGDVAVISLHEVNCRGTLISHCSLLQCPGIGKL